MDQFGKRESSQESNRFRSAQFSKQESKGERLELTLGISEAEVPSLGRIYREAFASPPWNENWTQTSAEKMIQEYRSLGADAVIVRFRGEPIGFAVGGPLADYGVKEGFTNLGASEESYFLADYAVADGCRGIGIGGAVLDGFVALASRSGATEIVTRTRFDNTPAIRAFEKVGFVEIGEEEAVSGGVAANRKLFSRKQ